MKKALFILMAMALLVSPAMAKSSDHYVVNIITDDGPAKELNGTVHIPFQTEYKILLKNNTDSRCSARVFIDDARVSPGGDFVIDAGGELLLERFVTDLDSGNRFRFVPLDDPAVDDPTRKENGIVRVEFRKEVEHNLSIQSIQVNDITIDMGTTLGSTTPWSFSVSPTFYTNVTNTSANGATVAGSESDQKFHKVDYNFEDSFTEIKLQLMGIEPTSAGTTLTQDELKELLDSVETWMANITTCYWIYDPQPDITTYELALLLPVLKSNDNLFVDTLNKSAQRHFKQVCD